MSRSYVILNSNKFVAEIFVVGTAALWGASTSAHPCSMPLHVTSHILLQGDVQYFIPHQILFSAWGDFPSSNLTLDVVSRLPGVRTELCSRCGFEPALKACFERFVAAGRSPLQLTPAQTGLLSSAGASFPIRDALHSIQAVHIFGQRNERDNQETLYTALNTAAPTPTVTQAVTPADEYREFLIDSVIAQIDVAFRKVAALVIPDAANEPSMRIPANLSSREIDVLTWLTQGKTNVEIADLLNISAHTVKNHAHRIFKKLKVANRTEVAALLGIPATDVRTSSAKWYGARNARLSTYPKYLF